MKSNASPSIRIVLADDHDLVRSGIGALLSSIGGVEVVAEARDGTELLQVLQTVRPDIVITDISMPGMDGYTAASRIHAEFPGVRVVILSAHDSVDAVKKAVASGACGYLRKDAPRFELEMAVRSVMHTGSYFGNGVAQMLLQPSEPEVDALLTDRQREVLVMIAQGRSAKEIGYDLGLSSKTVDVHRAKIMERLGLNDIASLTRYAVRKGLVKD
ncbi:MAG TPA: response regulator transcription factor [Ramlibacter sp.]|uniref:response regulator transcription factor n=1 Tax=Ramlibacter sp. TaxID=1917967 RepID=UPI002ED3870F